jgi:arabinofuranosyltransferase
LARLTEIQHGPRAQGRARALRVIAFFVVSAIVVYLTYLPWARHRFLIDDAFISYRYAANLVDGHGLVFNPGERVEGYTNFFWVLLAALPLRLGADAHAFCSTLGVTSFLASAVLCSAIAFFGREALGFWSLLSGLLALALFWLASGFSAISGSGLETAFVGLLIVALGALNHLWPARTRALRLLATIVPLVLVLTRLDAALAVAASALVLLFQEHARLGSFRAALRATLGRFGLTAIGLGAFLGWKLAYYGSPIPNTYFAKGADFAPLEVGVRYAVGFLRHAPWVLLLTPIALWSALVSARGPARSFARYALIVLSLHAAYVVKVGGDFMHYRFFWEVTPLFIAVVALGLSGLPSRALALTCALTALPLATVEPHLELQHEMHPLPKMDDYTRSGIRVGKALGKLPESTLIASTLAGTVGYYSRLPLVDEWGLSDRYVAELPIRSFAGRGHIKRAPLEYLRAREVNLVVGHPSFVACSKPNPDNRPIAFFRIGDDQCVYTWYLTQSPELTRHLCSAGDDVILHLVQCPDEKIPRNALRSPP